MFIFTTRRMFPSAKALARALSYRLGDRVRVTADVNTRLTGKMIRWGTSNPCPVSGVNRGDLIYEASQKNIFSSRMVNSGVSCVEIMRGTPEWFPVVIRRSLTGYGGIGISVCRDARDWSTFSGVYWSYYRNFRPELGVHIFNGKIIKLFRKERYDYLTEEEFPIRNAIRGYHFQRVELGNYPKLIPFVENFYDRFPIMFGRMDVGWDYDNKLYRVIEFNTAPCLTNNQDTLDVYTDEFVNIL